MGFALCAGPLAASCVSVGEGTGSAKSELLVAHDCWDDAFDLEPDFFAADPFRDTMHIRIQRGSDLLEFSDGVVILIDDVPTVREHLGEALDVTLPKGVAPPGVPVGGVCGDQPCSAPVHVALYLLDSCHTQNIVLYATEGTITFTELFNGDPNEKEADEKLTEGTFDVMVGDPRDIVLDGPDAGTIPNQSHLSGDFRFFFQRGQPAQPFP
ncbi:MAG: hypothetical protein HOW73_13440 [Polyangiaceae bacterium]|nr:hypothetical protein [Polyangiaceae bacterium]